MKRIDSLQQKVTAKPGRPPATFEMGEQRHSLVADGHVESVVLAGLTQPGKAVGSLDQLKVLLNDPNLQSLQSSGEGSSKVDVGTAEKWLATPGKSPGSIEIRRPGSRDDEQLIRLEAGSIQLTSRPNSDNSDEIVVHNILGRLNPHNGTITCIEESIALTSLGPLHTDRPGLISRTREVDATVLKPVQEALGDSVFSGFDDDRLDKLAKKVAKGADASPLPKGWVALYELDDRARPGLSFQIGNFPSLQLLHIDPKNHTVSLETEHTASQGEAFGHGSMKNVTLTHYPDGEVRRTYRSIG